MEKLDLKFENVPNNWAVCFNNSCPLKEQCLRHQAAMTVPDGVCYGMSVWPQAYKGGQCRMFAEIKTVTMAWGFSQLYKDLRHEDYKEIRPRMEDHFGRRQLLPLQPWRETTLACRPAMDSATFHQVWLHG